MVETIEKSTKTDEKSIFDGWSECRELLLKNVLKIFFYGLYNC